MTREDVLQAVSDWLTAASATNGRDECLEIRRLGFRVDPSTGRPVAVDFKIVAPALVGGHSVDVATRIVTP